LILALVCSAACVAVASASVNVWFDPTTQNVPLAAGMTTVDVVADIPEAEAILAWGLDLSLVGTSVALDSVAINETDWDAVFAPDGDGLAAIAPLANAVWGNGIVLATLSFTLEEEGLTELILSDTPGDLNEGFALEGSGFADVIYHTGAINVPEPASLLLLVAAGCIWRRR